MSRKVRDDSQERYAGDNRKGTKHELNQIKGPVLKIEKKKKERKKERRRKDGGRLREPRLWLAP